MLNETKVTKEHVLYYYKAQKFEKLNILFIEIYVMKPEKVRK